MEQPKESKPWKASYERNREAIKKRNLARYYEKLGRSPPPPRQPPPPPPNQEQIDRLNAIIEELRTLIPMVMKPKKVKKVKEDTPEEPPSA